MTSTNFEEPRAHTGLATASRAGFATLDLVAFALAAIMVLGPLLLGALGGS